ncbi:MAG: DUF1778 domain-containing protein [Nitrospinae bacterium]|nr:DUF1778 domain-containing protein [Nitrospinota bacterium]
MASKTGLKPTRTKSNKTDRIQFRISSESKNLLERAARYSNKSTSEFVSVQSVTAAERIVEQHEKVALSRSDWNSFFKVLDNPPEPNKRLRAAFKRYLDLNG